MASSSATCERTRHQYRYSRHHHHHHHLHHRKSSSWCFCLKHGFMMVLMPAMIPLAVTFLTIASLAKSSGAVTYMNGDVVRGETRVLRAADSPFHVRGDIDVMEGGSLVIEPGTRLRFEPGVGITVRGGSLSAAGDVNNGIEMTVVERESGRTPPKPSKADVGIRLVDGVSPLAGRLQLYHKGKWRSVCTNSRNWTMADFRTACRQMGFGGGDWFQWFDHSNDTRHLLLESPSCNGTQQDSLFACDWESRQMGSGVCDLYPDMGIQCTPVYREDTAISNQNWRGIRFINAAFTSQVVVPTRLQIKVSKSVLKYVRIEHAGRGPNLEAVAAVESIGVPPQMSDVIITNSAFHGMNVTSPGTPWKVSKSEFNENWGHGIYVNTSTGLVELDSCKFARNDADGVKYVFHDEVPEMRSVVSGGKSYVDVCKDSIPAGAAYPMYLVARQYSSSYSSLNCPQDYYSDFGSDGVLTVHFNYMFAENDNSGEILVYDGTDETSRLIGSFMVSNSTRPASMTTTSRGLRIRFKARPRTELVVFMEVTQSPKRGKAYDLRIDSCDVNENDGRGIDVMNLRSQVHVHSSQINSNNHAAGISVRGGVGDVNVTNSVISGNIGDGVNITHGGGARNVSRCEVSRNEGRGIAVWLNQTSQDVPFLQETTIEYSIIKENRWAGIFVGNFCTPHAVVNVSGNEISDGLKQGVDIWSCWKPSDTQQAKTLMHIGHNFFTRNRLAVRLEPVADANVTIEWNDFREQKLGTLLIRNGDREEIEFLPVDVKISDNTFRKNSGIFVASLGLSEFLRPNQNLTFTKNFVQDNTVSEPLENLNPRSRVAAVLVVTSPGVQIYRNILSNPESKYEIGVHYEDQSVSINCTHNWLGSRKEKEIYDRLFDRKNRYNLARLQFKPFLLISNNPNSESVSDDEKFVPDFGPNAEGEIGGEIEGRVFLADSENNVYYVKQDIYVRPGGELTITPGVVLEFHHGVGIMVAGKLHAEGEGSNLKERVTFTLFEQEKRNLTSIKVRLVGGKDSREGRLQVKSGTRWGTVCRMGWTMEAASLACRQMGYALNPSDWLLERSEMPPVGTNEDILFSNVKCSDLDTDITECEYETSEDFENSCTHEDDVGLRCYDVSWGGIRLSMTAEKSTLKYALVEKAGLFDHATNTFKPAVQIDYSRHILDNLEISDNWSDGLGLLHSDLYFFDPGVNTLSNSKIHSNKGNGISLRSLGLTVRDSEFRNNWLSGVQYNGFLSRKEQREIVSWLQMSSFKKHDLASMVETSLLLDSYDPVLLTVKQNPEALTKKFLHVRTKDENVIAIYVFSPIDHRSTEEIIIHDHHSVELASRFWDLKKHLLAFPANSSSFAFNLHYVSGELPVGGIVIMLKPVRVRDLPTIPGNFPGPFPSLRIQDTQFVSNRHGLSSVHYNRYLSDSRDRYLRPLKAYIDIVDCSIEQSHREAVFVHTPFRELEFGANMSEFYYSFNGTRFTGNAKGILQFSRDARDSNNLYHWVFRDDTLEGNKEGGIELDLPYVWQYNENQTHSVYMQNNTLRSNTNFGVTIDGHFARTEILGNQFDSNECKTGLIALKGMEKEMSIRENVIQRNFGTYMVLFNMDSQSEILGIVEANFKLNRIKRNRFTVFRGAHIAKYEPASYVVGVKGVQNINITNNLFGENEMDYELLAGIKTSSIDNYVNAVENWWGTNNGKLIHQRVFDFDDWNSYAIANFEPFYTSDRFDSPLSQDYTSVPESIADMEFLGGRLSRPTLLERRDKPYIVKSDLTVQEGVTLHIEAGVEIEFYPSVGILVLGTLRALGTERYPIKMRPIAVDNMVVVPIGRHSRSKPSASALRNPAVRLCLEGVCSDESSSMLEAEKPMKQGFVEIFNSTTLQWVPICDHRFSERNAEVVCRELGFDTLNINVEFGPRIEMHPDTLRRIISWPEPLRCEGDERSLEDCAIRMNGQLYGATYECPFDGDFLFVECSNRNLESIHEYWGGIRFSVPNFEFSIVHRRLHDHETHEPFHVAESVLEYVEISGAGVLHGELSPAVESVLVTPKIWHTTITQSAWHGISMVAPFEDVKLLHNRIENNQGAGISTLVLNGDGQASALSSFMPLRSAPLSYGLFGLVDICDTNKEIAVEERILLYYKYDNRPVDCVKIFTSSFQIKTFGFRLLYFNLYNSTDEAGMPDQIQLYDGDIYNTTSQFIANIVSGRDNGRDFHTTTSTSLSVKLHASGGSGNLGFVAEVVTIPVSAVGFNRDIQHNISHSIIANNSQGGILYSTAGEVNPIVTLERNQFNYNGRLLYGNFTTSKAAVVMDVQNTRNIFFKNNLVRGNQGGLWVKADAYSRATSLKLSIANCFFTDTLTKSALVVKGTPSGTYQDVDMFHTYITRSVCPYEDVIVLEKVLANLTYNYIHNNQGRCIMRVDGFNRVRLPIFQTFSHNGFYYNVALDRERPAVVVAGSAGQQYVDNVFVNPYTPLEMMTLNVSSSDVWKTPIDAVENWWGYNETNVVQGRIRDKKDDEDLLEVRSGPFKLNNRTLLSGKCPPGHVLIGATCFIYIGAPVTFDEAKEFCKMDNASMPYLQKDYYEVFKYIQHSQDDFQRYDLVWAQHYDILRSCSAFIDLNVQVTDCNYRLPFLCETDTRVEINAMTWLSDGIAMGAIAAVSGAVIVVLMCLAFWLIKSRHRHQEKLERRNSIRASARSTRSIVSSTSGGLNEYAFRRRIMQDQKSTTGSQITGFTDFAKLHGSMDSVMEKSQFNSSMDDAHSAYEAFETRNPTMSSPMSLGVPEVPSNSRKMVDAMIHPPFSNNHQLSYHNNAFRDTSLISTNPDGIDGASVNGDMASSERSTMKGHDDRDLWDAHSDVSSTPYYSGRSTFKAPPSEPDSTFMEVMRPPTGTQMPDFSKREVIGKEDSPPSQRSPSQRSPSLASVRYAQAQPITTSIRRGAGAASPLRRPPSMPPLPPSSPSVPSHLSTVGRPSVPHHYASTTLTIPNGSDSGAGMYHLQPFSAGSSATLMAPQIPSPQPPPSSSSGGNMGARTQSQPLETAM